MNSPAQNTEPANETVELGAVLNRLSSELHRLAASAADVQEAISFKVRDFHTSAKSIQDIQGLDALTQKLQDLARFSASTAHAIAFPVKLSKTAVFSDIILQDIRRTLDPDIESDTRNDESHDIEWL